MPNARFVVAGAGDRLRRTADRAAALGLAGRFEFTGFLDRGALDRLYETADVYVMPSVSEPFGLTALEALRHGVPVILSRHAGVSEVAPDVLRVDFDDARELASKILSVLRFPALSTTLARRGRGDIDGLSWKTSAARCLDVYREMRAGPAPERAADRIRI
jgi:glycosyltransferase involved in cell wall biosynthesis